MSLFLRKIVIFFALVSVVVAAICAMVLYVHSKLSYNIPVDKNILVMGHSHTECAVDDSIFTRAANLSLSARPMIASCNYIEKIVRDNKHIDTVLLGVNLNFFSEQWGRRYSEESKQICRSMLFNNCYDDFAYVCNGDLLYGLRFLLFDTSSLKPLLNHRLNTPGSYLCVGTTRLDKDLDSKRDDLPLKAEIDTTLYDYNRLLETKLFLDQRGVHLILVDTPKYNPSGEILEQELFHTLVKEHFADFDYIDYVSFPMPIDGYYDITHLNHKGAEIFSRYIQEHGIATYEAD